jgi:hypothetical protein
MNCKLLRVALSAVTLGLTVGLGTQAKAVTLSPGTTVLSDTTEFLDFQINLNQITAPFGTNPPGQFGPPPPGPSVPLFLGQNWNVFGSRTALMRGSGVDLLVEQATPGSTLAGPKAAFSGGTFRFDVFVSNAQASYLADSPAQTFNSVTCVAGSPNCVSYEFKTLTPTTECPSPCGAPNGFIEPIFELKGFFNPSDLPPVPEGKTGVGALMALGLILLMRSRHNTLKNAPKTLP